MRASIHSAILRNIISVFSILIFVTLPVFAQKSETKETSVVVQPGAPGQPSKILPSSTNAKLPKRSPKDVEFMQGMIMHHAQAVEMVALMEDRTKNKELLLLGKRISHTQADEMNQMKRWLINRGEKTSMQPMNMSGMDMKNMDMSDHKHHMMMMPGMLTPEQMKNLAQAKDSEFDRLFLEGMIQHHNGALIMVKDLFETTGAGQDAELFNFATDVDSSQRAEIRIMQEMLGGIPQQEKK